ncbi:MAG TPA: hypothetical protein VGN57_04900 [Pirellulaceae bacterium]|jgi:hypothetical protein|nr:hypothetical protein [Pirellulaceae bacterium]
MSDATAGNGQQVSHALTLVMELASDEAAAQLKAYLDKMDARPVEENDLRKALDNIGTVHFARFVFLGDGRFAVITTYDGSFEDYLDKFANNIGEIFDNILSCMKEPPARPVKQNVQEFIRYVRERDLTLDKPFYSAYPDLKVQDILALRTQAGRG